MVSFSYPATASLPSREVRAALILTSVIGVTLNIVMAALGRAKVEGALGITFVRTLNIFPFPYRIDFVEGGKVEGGRNKREEREKKNLRFSDSYACRLGISNLY